jgi:hypothetical protein
MIGFTHTGVALFVLFIGHVGSAGIIVLEWLTLYNSEKEVTYKRYTVSKNDQGRRQLSEILCITTNIPITAYPRF